MKKVKVKMEKEGFHTEDVSLVRNPSFGCDFIFTHKEDSKNKIYAEIKGTTSNGKKVLVTHTEVKKSKEYGDKSALCSKKYYFG